MRIGAIIVEKKRKHFNPTKRNQEVNNGFLLNFIIKHFAKYQN